MNLENNEEGSLSVLSPVKNHLNTGLNVVGKLYLNGPEWTGKFAQKQYDHVEDHE